MRPMLPGEPDSHAGALKEDGEDVEHEVARGGFADAQCSLATPGAAGVAIKLIHHD